MKLRGARPFGHESPLDKLQVVVVSYLASDVTRQGLESLHGIHGIFIKPCGILLQEGS